MNDQFLIDIKNHMNLIAEGLRIEIRLLADGILGNTRAIERLEVQVDHLYQEVQIIKYDLADLRSTAVTKDEAKSFATRDDLKANETKIITALRKEFRNEILPLKGKVTKLDKEVFK